MLTHRKLVQRRGRRTKTRPKSGEFGTAPAPLVIHKDETVEELCELRRGMNPKHRRALGLKTFRNRSVSLAGYPPDDTFEAVRFDVVVQLGKGRHVRPGHYIMFDAFGPMGDLSPAEFRRYTKRAEPRS